MAMDVQSRELILEKVREQITALSRIDAFVP